MKHVNNDDRLDIDLPQRRSSQALDDKVLDYARQAARQTVQQRAPQSRPNALPWWMTGLATASVAGLALLLVTGEPGLDPQVNISESTVASAEIAADMAPPPNPAPAPAPAPTEPEPAPQVAVISAPAPALQAGAVSRSRASAGVILATEPVAASNSESRFQVSLEQEIVAAADATIDVTSDMADEVPAAAAAAKKTAEVQADEEPIWGDEVMAAPEPVSAAAPARMDANSIREALKDIAALAAKGDDEQATEAYTRLKADCSDCELPPTLEEALQRYQLTEPAPPKPQ